MTEEERLRKVMARVISEHKYTQTTLDELIGYMVPAILDEFDDEFEKAWMYDTLD